MRRLFAGDSSARLSRRMRGGCRGTLGEKAGDGPKQTQRQLKQVPRDRNSRFVVIANFHFAYYFISAGFNTAVFRSSLAIVR